jgi:hypothetical protein
MCKARAGMFEKEKGKPKEKEPPQVTVTPNNGKKRDCFSMFDFFTREQITRLIP